MDDPDSENESLEASVQELENKVERLEEQNTGRNQIRMQAYDIQVQANSEDTSMQELASICSEQMDEMMKRALVGEYQELEREDLFTHILGDD
jgi:hypothetical protein